MALIAGVDEAGRGPCLGPLVVAGVVIDEKLEEDLIRMGITDSKLIAPKKREQLFDIIKEKVKDYKIIVISPEEIDEAVNSKTTNLNWLEATHYAIATNYLKPDTIIVDCPSTNIEAFTEYFKKLLIDDIRDKVNIKCEHKADLNYPVAGAASILAKVTRDREIEKLKQKYGNIGSGYPADPTTQKFLAENYEKLKDAGIFRKSWACYKKLVKGKNQKSLGEF
ncbi:ribonuclease HII [Nanoarchaeota archaeon]